MRRKTESQILTDMYQFVKSSVLATVVNGKVYKSKQRPCNSEKEDIVINLVSGTPAQIQTGVININIFIPDKHNGGAMVCDERRCREIEAVAEEWVEGIEDFDGYRLELDKMIGKMQYEDKRQHFVNIRLKFDYLTF